MTKEVSKFKLELERRQYKNDGIAERNLFVLNLPRFLLPNTVRKKGGNFKIKKILSAIEKL